MVRTGTTLLVTWCIYTLLLELGYMTVTSGTNFYNLETRQW